MMTIDFSALAQNVIFGILAAMVIIPALLVVTLKNVFHCALWLVVTLAGLLFVCCELEDEEAELNCSPPDELPLSELEL